MICQRGEKYTYDFDGCQECTCKSGVEVACPYCRCSADWEIDFSVGFANSCPLCICKPKVGPTSAPYSTLPPLSPSVIPGPSQGRSAYALLQLVQIKLAWNKARGVFKFVCRPSAWHKLMTSFPIVEIG